MEDVGIRAVVEGLQQYLGDVGRMNSAVSQHVGQVKSAEDSYRVFEQAQRQSMQRLGETGNRLRSAGTQMAIFGAAIGAAGAGSLKLAVDFESSFAGIRKTVDATEEEFQRLAQANRDLAKEIPVSVNELNRIGELGGQLGIATDALVDFEATIAKLAVTTDLTADEAALSFAQIANIIQLPQDQIENLGSAIVGLGNNFATTESRIVDFTQRIAGAGALAGIGAGEIAGIATAFASLGVEAEAGGTATQKVILSLQQAAVNGGAELKLFADTAGLSAEEFKDLFERDAAAAFTAFVEGLGRQGDQAIKTLAELDLTDQRLLRSFLAVAGAGDLLTRSIQKGSDEFEKNTALQEEAAKRFETTASQITLLKNQLVDLGISAGQDLLPVLRLIVDGLQALAAVIDMIPGPIRTVLVGAALLGGGLLILLGTVGFLAGSLLSLVSVLGLVAGGAAGATISTAALTAGFSALAASATAAAIAAAPFAVGLAAIGIAAIAVKSTLDEASREADNFSKQTREAMDEGGAAVRAQLEEWEALRDELIRDRDEFRALGKDTSDLDKVIGDLIADIVELRQSLGETSAALEDEAAAMEAGSGAAEDFEEAMGDLTLTTEEAAEAAEKAVDSFNKLRDAARDAMREAFAGFAQGGEISADVLGASRGDAPRGDSLANAIAGGFTFEDFVRNRAAGASAASAAAAAGRSGGGAGEKTAAEEIAERRAAALEQQAQREQDALVEAFFTGGERRVQLVNEQFRRLDGEFNAFAADLQRVFGIDVPEEFRAMWEELISTQDEGVQAAIEAERLLAAERQKAIDQAKVALGISAASNRLGGGAGGLGFSVSGVFGVERDANGNPIAGTGISVGVGGVAGSFADAAKAVVAAGLKNGLDDAAINALLEQLSEQVANPSNPINPIGLATGGLVTSPTRALVAESGPEVVIPLSDLGTVLPSLMAALTGSTGSQTAGGSVTVITEDRSPAAIAHAVVVAQREQGLRLSLEGV